MAVVDSEPAAQHPLELEIGSKPSHPPPEIDYTGLALVFLAPALGGFIYGYDVGATSFALAMMRAPRDHDVWWYHFPKIQQGLLISSLALGALIGSHIVLVYLAETIGRRREIRVAASLYIMGATLNIISGTLLAPTEVYGYGLSIGLAVLLCGRLLTGVGVGFIMHGAPTYMAEMSPTAIRGTLVSAKETVIVFGIVVGMLNGDLLSDYSDNWAGTCAFVSLRSFFAFDVSLDILPLLSLSLSLYLSIYLSIYLSNSGLYYITIFAAVPMLLLTFRIPRSKRWLLMKGYRDEAKESMGFVYKGDFNDEFEKLAETMNSLCCRQSSSTIKDDASEGDGSFEDNGSIYTKSVYDDPDVNADGMFSPQYRQIMFLGIGLLSLQQFSGQPAVLAYSRVLFEAAGWGANSSVFSVLIMGVTSSLTVANVDRLGRKVFLKAGSIIMTMAVACLAYGFWNWDEEDEDVVLSNTKKTIVFWAMIFYVAGYQVGFGPITWTVLSEVYPTEIRGKAMAFSVEVNFLCKFLSQLFFPVFQDLVGWGSTFIIFTCTCAIGFIFVTLAVTETKGMSLEEIQAQYGRKASNKHIPPEIVKKPLESPLLANKNSNDESPREIS